MVRALLLAALIGLTPFANGCATFMLESIGGCTQILIMSDSGRGGLPPEMAPEADECELPPASAGAAAEGSVAQEHLFDDPVGA